jgi:hypothetical protein
VNVHIRVTEVPVPRLGLMDIPTRPRRWNMHTAWNRSIVLHAVRMTVVRKRARPVIPSEESTEAVNSGDLAM